MAYGHGCIQMILMVFLFFFFCWFNAASFVQVVMNQLQQIKVPLRSQYIHTNICIVSLPAINVSSFYPLQFERMKIEEKRKVEEQDLIRVMRDKDRYEVEISLLKQELELTKKTYEKNCSELENQAKETKSQLENKIMELESLLTDSRKKVKELEAFTESKYLRWRRKEHGYKRFIDSHFGSVQVCINFMWITFSTCCKSDQATKYCL